MQPGISMITSGWAVGVPGNLPEKSLPKTDLLDRAQAFGHSLVQFGDNHPLFTLSPTHFPYSVNLTVKDFDIQQVPRLMGFLMEGWPEPACFRCPGYWNYLLRTAGARLPIRNSGWHPNQPWRLHGPRRRLRQPPSFTI